MKRRSIQEHSSEANKRAAAAQRELRDQKHAAEGMGKMMEGLRRLKPTFATEINEHIERRIDQIAKKVEVVGSQDARRVEGAAKTIAEHGQEMESARREARAEFEKARNIRSGDDRLAGLDGIAKEIGSAERAADKLAGEDRRAASKIKAEAGSVRQKVTAFAKLRPTLR